MKFSKLPGRGNLLDLKVAYVTREAFSSDVEGHSTASSNIIKAAQKSGVAPYVIDVEKETPPEQYPKNYVILNSVVNKRVYSSFFSSIFFAANDLLLAPKIIAHLKLSDCDLIHVLNLNKEAYSLTHTLLRLNKPVCLHLFHSPFVLNDDVFRFRKFMFKSGLYSRILSNHTITSNVSMHNFLVEEFRLDEKRVHYVPIPINTNHFRPMNQADLRKKYGLPIDCPIVAYAGSLDPSRGIFDLLESFENVAKSFPDSLLFISYLRRNGEEIYEAKLHSLARSPSLKNRVILTGPSPNVEEIYNLADVVAFPFTRPYWFDPPLVLLEAMSSGAAVVSTSVGAISEVIHDRHNGVLVPPKDPLLANAISELFSNPDERCRLARNARKTIIEMHSYEKVGNKLLNVYHQVQNI
jgi:glycosyltransferase involved in cell wall biosynthesis